ncbi:hypothetical protein Tco_1136915 [Tanacetum coccineum]
MSNLKFAETHNLVAFLEKPKESDGFEGIIDFLNASSIRYALTVNPTIYTSCIKQFWATAKAKTVNGEVQIQALVDGKKVIVTETSLRRALHLKDAEGNESPEELGEGSKIPIDPQHTPTIIQPSTSQPQKKQPKRNQRKYTEHVPTHSNDLLLSGEDRLKLKELLEICIKLSERVHDLENTETSQAVEITKLKEGVKKLEKRNKSRTPRLERLRKGRKIVDLDVDAEEVKVEKVVSTAQVTTVSAITTIVVDELTMAQTLIEIKVAKPKVVTTDATTTTTAITRPKARGVVVEEPSEFTKTTSPSQLSQLPQAKDKAQLNAELEEEEKLAKQSEEDANIAKWDNVQAMIDANYELAARLHA